MSKKTYLGLETQVHLKPLFITPGVGSGDGDGSDLIVTISGSVHVV